MSMKWTKTDLASAPKNDFVGRDPKNPKMFARIYRSRNGASDKPWFWSVSVDDRRVGSGNEASAKEAAARAEEAYLEGTRSSRRTGKRGTAFHGFATVFARSASEETSQNR